MQTRKFTVLDREYINHQNSELSIIKTSDFKNNEDMEWLKKITKNETKKNEILEFKKFVDKLSSL